MKSEIIPACQQGTGQRGLFSFTKENSPLLIPQEKGFDIARLGLEEVHSLRNREPAWQHRIARCHWRCDTTCLCSYYPLPLC